MMHTKHLKQKVINKAKNLFLALLILASLFGLVAFTFRGVSFLGRLYHITAASIEARTEYLTEHQAPVTGKDAGFLAGGYTVQVEIAGEKESVYVLKDEYLSTNVGDKYCITYQKLDGQSSKFRLCGVDDD